MKGKVLKIATILTLVFTLALTFMLGDSASVLAAEKLSDLDTTIKYVDSLGDSYSTEFAGRVWTDKSVFSQDSVTFNDSNITVQNDEDFLVSLSALATSKEVTGQQQAPVDVVFVIDISGSMSNTDSTMDDGESRIKNTIDALNDSIKAIMDLNPYTRVAVVGFSNSSTVLLPLDRYDKATHNNNRGNAYFTLNRSVGSSNTTTLYTKAISQTTNQTISRNDDVTGGTNTQVGMYTGMNILATESLTTANINGQEVQRIPAVILLSDGASTFSSDSSSWWAPSSNYNDGPGANEDSYGRVKVVVGSGLKALMTSSYMKDAIDRNYFGNNVSEAFSTKVHTIGMGITDLPGDEQNYAYAILNPGAYLYKNIDSTAIETIETAFNSYKNDNSPTVSVGSYSFYSRQREFNSTYKFNHPTTQYDIDDLNYVNSYHGASSASSVTNAFRDIVDSISISTPQVPTEVSNSGNITNDGYITFVDPIGKYLEVKDVKQIIWHDQVFTNSTSSSDGTYVFQGDVETFVHGTQSVSHIIIKVDEDASGNQTITVKIPASLIPLRINTVKTVTDGDGDVIVDTHTTNNAMPVRVLYTVGLKDDVMVDGVVNTEVVSQDYIRHNLNDDGTVNFYSNLYTERGMSEVGAIAADHDGTVGTTTATFEPAPTNPFYYMQGNTVVYKYHDDVTGEYSGTFSSIDELKKYEGTVYYSEQYYHGTTLEDGVVTRSVKQLLATELDVVDGKVVRVNGSPRFNRVMRFEGEKIQNSTHTATEFYVPTYVEEEDPTHEYDGKFVVYLGNNGTLKVNAVGALQISKTVTADQGLIIDENKQFDFTVELTNDEGVALSGTYSYVITNGENQTTGTIASGDTIKLKANDILTINGLPHNSKYTVTEKAEAGYTTVANGKSGHIVYGTITAGQTSSKDYINHYSVKELTYPTNTEISGVKVIDGRDWQEGDTFKFKVSAVNGGPLPTNSEITLTIPEGTKVLDGQEVPFNFGTATFTKPGEYIYTITEEIPDTRLPGMSYTKAIYQVVINVVDNGDGTLSATSQMYQIADQAGNEMISAPVENKVAKFINEFNAEAVNYAPIARKIYIDNTGSNGLTNGMFTFNIEALSDGAPMPANKTVYNYGENVTFGYINFTQDHVGKTFEYEISEVIPELKQTGMTYDENKVKLTIEVYLDEDKVAVKATYSNNKDRAEFTNTYTAKPDTLSTKTNDALGGTKTLIGRDMLDSDVFEFTLEAYDEVTKQALKDGSVVVVDDKATIKNPDALNGEAEAFAFDDITFTKPGVYKFVIKEVKGTLGGVTYDETSIIATVNVVDNNGQLEATTVYNNGLTGAHFTNTYNSVFTGEPIDLNAVKVLTGQTLETGEFFYSIQLNDGEIVYVTNGEGVQTNKGYEGIISFLNNVTYDKAGTYRYTIKESIPKTLIKGFTYDYSEYIFEVIVTDNNDGTLTATSSITQVKDKTGNEVNKTVDEIVFNNEYVPENALYKPFNLIKTLVGRPLGEGEFTFFKKLVSGDPQGIHFLDDTDGDNYVETTNKADGKVQFADVEFSKVGTYVIEIGEVIPEGATDNNDGTYTYNGVIYDTHILTSRFVVTDTQVGNLEVVRTDSMYSREFVNKYTSTGELDGDIYLNVVKNYKDNANNPWTHESLKDHTFTFNLEVKHPNTLKAIEDDIIEMPNEDELTITVDSEGYAEAFGNIRFNKAGTYEFVVREDTSAPISGVQYDETPRIVVVTVTEKLTEGQYTGELEATAKVYLDENNNAIYDENEAETTLTFNNIYEPGETVLYGHDNLEPVKVFVGRENNEWLATDEFTFILAAGDDVTSQAIADNYIIMPSALEVTLNKDNEQYGHFGDITFKKAGRFTFTVTERNDGKAGITYDITPRKIIVDVVDEDGILTVYLNSASDSLTFNNVYKTTPVTLPAATNLVVEKVFTGRQWNSNDEFTFTLESALDYGANVELGKTTVTISDETKDYKDSFGDIKFNNPGTYYFIVKETKGTDDNIIYDEKETVVSVKVEDNTLGQLVISDVEYTVLNTEDDQTSAMTFTNKYSPDPVTIDVKGTKLMVGRELKNTDKFTFVLTALDNAPMPTNKTVLEVENNGKDIDFGTIQYTKPGTYHYTIYEKAYNAQGVVSDSQVINVKVVVTYNENDGTLKAVASYNNQETFSFTNTYVPNKVDLVGTTDLAVKKIFTGRENNEWLSSDKFRFIIQSYDEKTTQAIVDGSVEIHDGQIITIDSATVDQIASFENITFHKVGTYTFAIKELNDQIAGITYDSSVKVVKVIVTDDGQDGQLDIKAEDVVSNDQENGLYVFTNTYKYKDVVLDGNKNLKVFKNLVGREWFNNDQFTFKLEAVEDYGNNVVLPENAKGITINKDSLDYGNSFGNITFKAPGTYQFKISEVKGDISNIVYSEEVTIVTVNVVDNKQGHLVCETVEYNGNMTFTNTYTPNAVSATLNGNKTIQGREFIADLDKYEFVIRKAQNTPVNTPLPQNTTVMNNADGKFTFGPITYSEAGTYTYVITEKSGTVPGITYDSGYVVVNVQITYDQTTGTFNKPVVSYKKVGGLNNGQNELEFINVYNYENVTLEGKTNLEVTKDLQGRKWFITDEFTFILQAVEDYGEKVILPDNAQGITISDDTKDHKTAFNDITFNAPGTYKFRISEVKGNISNITYSEQVSEVSIVVTDNKEGQLVITSVNYNIAKDPLTFTNTFNPTGINVEFTGKKLMDGRDLKDSDIFTFTLSAIDNAPLPAQTQVTNTLDKIEFEAITYDKVGTYKYTIVEEDTTIGGVSKDPNIIQVVVKVTYDENTGLFNSEVTYDEKETFEFVNTYKANEVVLEGSTHLQVSKNLTGRLNDTWLDTDKFTFVLEAKEDYGEAVILPDNAQGITITKDSPEHKAAFNNIIFKQVGTYEFTIREIDDGIKGITYDHDLTRDIKVIVSDEGQDGQLDIKESDITTDILTFNNTYGVLGTTVQFEAIKVLEGRQLKDNEFKFILENIETNEKLEAYADKNGKVVFDEIKYNKIGTYNYVVYEEDTQLHNVAYDQTRYEIKVEVKDDNEGQLYTVITGYNNNLEFKNFFTPDPIEVHFSGIKILTGRELKEKEFNFTIEAIDNAPLPQITTVTHDKDGKFEFGTIIYTTEGIYDYIISEDDNDIAGITYDENDVKVRVEVVRSDDGILSYNTTYTKQDKAVDRAVFTNTYNTQPTDEIVVDIIKKVISTEGNEYILNGGEFEFELIPFETNENDPISVESLKGTNTKEGKVVFEHQDNFTLQYNVKGIYQYTLHELSDKALPGITYDDSTYIIKVEVTDDEAIAKLGAKVTINDVETNTIEFVNKYNPGQVNTIISGMKVLESEHKLLEDGEFEFVIEGDDNTKLPDVTKVTNNESGYFSFPAIEYTYPGVHNYTVYEVDKGELGYSYDDAVYNITVIVEHDQENGTLKLTKTMTKANELVEDIEFVNKYTPTYFTLDKDTTIAIEGTKELIGRDGLAIQDGEFTFKLLDHEGNIALDNQGNELIVGVKDGQIVFDNITYTKAGTYNYTIVEEQGNALGITYDKSVYAVVVTVEDLGGYLDGTVQYYKDNIEVEDVVFTNIYAPVIDAFIKFNAEKVLIGRQLKANEFRFVLENVETGEKTYAYANEHGIVEFDKIDYTEVGVYNYKVYEEKGILENITYDDVVYNITVEVKDDLQGNLVATATDDSNGLVFTNIYTPDPLNIDLTINKVLENGEESHITLDQFSFEIASDDQSKIIQGTKDGQTLYGLSFDQSNIGKTVHYSVKEVNTKVDNVTYDKDVHDLSITILQNEDGTLYADMTIDGQAVEELIVEFNNTYTKPVDTSDTTHIVLWLTLMMGSSLLIKVLRKKEEF